MGLVGLATIRSINARMGALSLLVAALLAGSGQLSPSAADSKLARVDVAELTTEHLPNPLGIDASHPRLGWVLHSGGRAVRQSAYEVVVSSSADNAADGEGDVWDSGKVASPDSFDIAY